MQQSDFNILVTNSTAVANQVFSCQCGDFASNLSSGDDNELVPVAFNLEKHLNEFNFQEVLDSGYGSIPELELELCEAWAGVNVDELSGIISQLPSEFSGFTKKLRGKQLSSCVAVVLNDGDNSPFFKLHQAIMPLFQQWEESPEDAIREAIAFDEISSLDEAVNILPEHVSVEDLITSATIQSFKVFTWLVKCSNIDSEGMTIVLREFVEEEELFNTIFRIFSPNDVQKSDIARALSDCPRALTYAVLS